jgi:hypothetical protein
MDLLEYDDVLVCFNNILKADYKDVNAWITKASVLY